VYPNPARVQCLRVRVWCHPARPVLYLCGTLYVTCLVAMGHASPLSPSSLTCISLSCPSAESLTFSLSLDPLISVPHRLAHAIRRRHTTPSFLPSFIPARQKCIARSFHVIGFVPFYRYVNHSRVFFPLTRLPRLSFLASVIPSHPLPSA
jgi:hypothetical protein